MNCDRITENTVSDRENFAYVIFLDDLPCGFCKTQTNARYHINDLADALEKELEEPNTRVLRRNVNENEIHISRQRQGLMYDGAVKLKHTLRVVSVAKYFKYRKAPVAPPLPPQSK